MPDTLKMVSWGYYLLIGLVGFVCLLLLDYWNTSIAGTIVLGLFLLDFVLVKRQFLIIKSIEGYFGIDLKDFLAPLVLIFSWVLYSFVQLMCVFYLFHTLLFPDFLLRWIFPLVAIKSIWLAYQIGRKPVFSKPLLGEVTLGVKITILQVFSSGCLVGSVLLELFEPYSSWEFDKFSLGRVAFLSAMFLAINSTVWLFYKMVKAKAKYLAKQDAG